MEELAVELAEKEQELANAEQISGAARPPWRSGSAEPQLAGIKDEVEILKARLADAKREKKEKKERKKERKEKETGKDATAHPAVTTALQCGGGQLLQLDDGLLAQILRHVPLKCTHRTVRSSCRRLCNVRRKTPLSVRPSFVRPCISACIPARACAYMPAHAHSWIQHEYNKASFIIGTC